MNNFYYFKTATTEINKKPDLSLNIWKTVLREQNCLCCSLQEARLEEFGRNYCYEFSAKYLKKLPTGKGCLG